MLEIGDPAFKLFGKTIPLFFTDEFSGDSINAAVSSKHSIQGKAEQKSCDEPVLKEDPSAISASKDETDADNQTISKKGSISSEDQNSPNSTDENSAAESEEDEKAQGEESKSSAEKTLKKPDKILPCPRCNSMETKFCYYNNYNVNQPRHFCKSCQRYWTAGGTMRNVPVGAGRRKNKSATLSKYCHLSISEALQAARFDLPHKSPDFGLKANGTVLSFGADSPLSDSMASMMNLGEKKILNGTKNGFNVGDDRLSGSSTVTTSSSIEEGALERGVNPMQQIPHVFPGFQLAYGWSPPPAFFPAMPFYPAHYWNGAVIPMNMLSPKGPGSNPASPTLGKHSREGDILMTSTKVEKSLGSPRVLVPKTLRIDDPEEAAKSSIWTTLGIKNVEPTGNGGFFKGLESKSKDTNHKMESFPVINANPAALDRSLSFQETA